VPCVLGYNEFKRKLDAATVERDWRQYSSSAAFQQGGAAGAVRAFAMDRYRADGELVSKFGAPRDAVVGQWSLLRAKTPREEVIAREAAVEWVVLRTPDAPWGTRVLSRVHEDSADDGRSFTGLRFCQKMRQAYPIEYMRFTRNTLPNA